MTCSSQRAFCPWNDTVEDRLSAPDLDRLSSHCPSFLRSWSRSRGLTTLLGWVQAIASPGVGAAAKRWNIGALYMNWSGAAAEHSCTAPQSFIVQQLPELCRRRHYQSPEAATGLANLQCSYLMSPVIYLFQFYVRCLEWSSWVVFGF